MTRKNPGGSHELPHLTGYIATIRVVDDEGTIQFETKIPAEVEEIDKCLKRFNPAIKSVGFESGTLTQYLTYGLQVAGYEVICLEA